MGRPVVLSNNQLFVGLNERGLVHDFYYPYVGLENLTNARSSQHKIGLWVDGQFSWTDGSDWNVQVDFAADALISRVTMINEGLQVRLEFNDWVEPNSTAFIRHCTLHNLAAAERDIRLFMHQVFQISRAGRADTAMYVPDGHYLLDYKGRCCLLIAGKLSAGGDFDQYAVGNYGIEGKAGTFKDAEDGELSGNAVEHGGVDSVLRFSSRVPAGGHAGIDYWVIGADSQSEAHSLHLQFKSTDMAERLRNVQTRWQRWLSRSQTALNAMPADVRAHVSKSLLVIKAHCDERGSVLASGDSSIFNFGRDYYCYCWPRDAAYAVWPLIRLGQYTEAKRFFEFARDTMNPGGYMMHKYQPDRAIGSTWHPLVHGRASELAIQEDETAIVVYMIGEYYRHSRDLTFVEAYYDSFIKPCSAFMAGFVDEATGLPHASYDLWEQKFSTSTYTVCTVIAAMEVATQLAELTAHPQDAVRWRAAVERMRGGLDALYQPEAGYFRKGFLLQPDGNLQYDDTLDISSFYGAYMFARLNLQDERLKHTAQAVEKQLLNTSPVGGVLRFPGDDYFLAKRQYAGNPWIVCTMWLAQYYIAAKQTDEARALVAWARARALPSGILSEQFDPESGDAISVAPLVWSHAELINTLLDLYE